MGQGRKNDGPQLASARACGPGNIAIASGCFSLDAPHTRIRYHKKWTHQVRHPDVSDPRAVARPTYRIDLRLPCKATYGHRRVWLVFSLRPHAMTTATTNFRPSRAPDHAPRISGDSEVMLEIQRARPGPPTGIGTGALHLGAARHVGLSQPSSHAVPYTLATMMLVCDAAGVPSRQESDVLRASRHDGRLFELRRRDRLPAAGAATSRLQPCSALARVAPAAELTLCQRYTITNVPPR